MCRIKIVKFMLNKLEYFKLWQYETCFFCVAGRNKIVPPAFKNGNSILFIAAAKIMLQPTS